MKRKIHFSGILLSILLIILFALLKSHTHAGNPSTVPIPDTIEAKLFSEYDQLLMDFQEYIYSSIQAENVPGAAIGIVKGNHTLYQNCFGVKEVGTNDSIDLYTLFRIGSVSKGFASVLAAILVRDSIIEWNDKVKYYVKNLELMNDEYEDKLTIRHILSQTTGFPKHTFTNLLDENVSYNEIKPLLKDVPMFAPPGECFSYQNVAYSLISDVIESAASQKYTVLLNEKIFLPLSMNSASTDFYSMIACDNIAMPHVKTFQNKWERVGLNNRYYTVEPASGINASLDDMIKWLKALLGESPEVIDTVALNQIYNPQIKIRSKFRFIRNNKDTGKLYYGLGWRIVEYKNCKIIYHAGYVEGYRAEIAFIPDKKIGIVALFNGSSQLSGNCVPTFFEKYLAMQEYKYE